MLTSDLARYEFVGQEVRPRYISRGDAQTYLPIAASIIDLFNANIGQTRAAIEDNLECIEREADFKIVRGLAKLVEDECVYDPIEPLNFSELRANVFGVAQRHYPLVTHTDLLHQKDRTQALDEIAHDLSIERERLEWLLFADLPNRHILKELQKPFTPESLLQRYNLAQAQALLYWAKELRITLFSDYKLVWKYVKLARLIHEMEKSPDGYVVQLAGPMSIFRQGRRYGIRMALFLPGLLLAKRFSMTAMVSIHGKNRQFVLNEQSGLHSTYRESRAPFDSSLEERFFEQFSSLPETGWTIRREDEIIDLGDTVLIPDFTFTHSDGRRASLEIVGFWTPEYLGKKIGKLSRANIPNLVIAINQAFNCSRQQLPSFGSAHVVFFKTVLKAKVVLNCLEAMELQTGVM